MLVSRSKGQGRSKGGPLIGAPRRLKTKRIRSLVVDRGVAYLYSIWQVSLIKSLYDKVTTRGSVVEKRGVA